MCGDGLPGIGTAFHIGDGVYLTARHVLENTSLQAVVPISFGNLFEEDLKVPKPTNAQIVIDGQFLPVWSIEHEDELKFEGPFFHPDERIDVAAFRLVGLDPNTPHLLLGGHYDDWIRDPDWLLSKGTAFGFPPIPFTTDPTLVAASVEVNAVIDTWLDRYVRFVVSGPPRGGFSGGPVVHEWGFVLGMTIQSLEQMHNDEGGFFTVLSIEALRECLDHHNMTPDYQVVD